MLIVLLLHFPRKKDIYINNIWQKSKLATFGRAVFVLCERTCRQTDRQTDVLIAVAVWMCVGDRRWWQVSCSRSCLDPRSALKRCCSARTQSSASETINSVYNWPTDWLTDCWHKTGHFGHVLSSHDLWIWSCWSGRRSTLSAVSCRRHAEVSHCRGVHDTLDSRALVFLLH